MRKPRPQGHVRVRLMQLTRGGEWWRSFCSLAGGGECGCSYYSDVARTVVCGEESYAGKVYVRSE